MFDVLHISDLVMMSVLLFPPNLITLDLGLDTRNRILGTLFL